MGLDSESNVIRETWIESIPLPDPAEDIVTPIGSLNSTILLETPTLLSQLDLSDDLEVSTRSIGSIPLTENSPVIIDGIMTPNILDDSISEYREAGNPNTPDVTSTANLIKAGNYSFQIKDIIANSSKHNSSKRPRSFHRARLTPTTN